jgi:hypothetical protein
VAGGGSGLSPGVSPPLLPTAVRVAATEVAKVSSSGTSGVSVGSALLGVSVQASMASSITSMNIVIRLISFSYLSPLIFFQNIRIRGVVGCGMWFTSEVRPGFFLF